MSNGHLQLLLGRLEELITKSPRFAGRALVMVDEASEILKKIQRTLPTEVKTADEILQQKEAILQEAREEASRILRRSSTEAKRLLSEHHITKLAREESKEIKAKAYSYLQQVEKEADQYVHEVLGRLEENLLQALKVVHQAKEDYASDQEKGMVLDQNDES